MMMKQMMMQMMMQMKPCRAFRCRSLEKGLQGFQKPCMVQALYDAPLKPEKGLKGLKRASFLKQGARAFRLEALDDAEADARAFLKALDADAADDDEALKHLEALDDAPLKQVQALEAGASPESLHTYIYICYRHVIESQKIHHIKVITIYDFQIMKKNYFIIKNARKASYLVGDSVKEGKDQVLSDTLKYNKLGLYDEQNAARLEDARKRAAEGEYNNIRLVTVFFDAICIKQGIIDYKQSRRTEKPFDIQSRKSRSWA